MLPLLDESAVHVPDLVISPEAKGLTCLHRTPDTSNSALGLRSR